LGAYSRSQCREWALKFLYQADFVGGRGREDLERFWSHFGPLLIIRARKGRAKLIPFKNIGLRVGPVRRLTQISLINYAPPAYLRNLVKEVAVHREELDALIARYSEHWRLERMTVIDINLLRLAASELLYIPKIPPKVVINEAIRLAKRYGSEDSGGFVNAILDQIRAAQERPGQD
jgi:transcription antitermination factor NusB